MKKQFNRAGSCLAAFATVLLCASVGLGCFWHERRRNPDVIVVEPGRVDPDRHERREERHEERREERRERRDDK